MKVATEHEASIVAGDAQRAHQESRGVFVAHIDPAHDPGMMIDAAEAQGWRLDQMAPSTSRVEGELMVCVFRRV